jgi:phosphoglycolate phosphatase
MKQDPRRKERLDEANLLMHILFDLDGTLTDSKPGIIACIEHAMRKLQIEIDASFDLNACIGPPLHDTFKKLCGDEMLVGQAISIYRERFSTVGLFENRVYDGIPDCLQQLAAKVDSINIATSKPKVYSEKIVEHYGLDKYVNEVYGSHLDGRLGDKSELIGHALKSEGIRPEETVMVGDRHFDIIGAKSHGMRSIGVLWGYGSKEELDIAGADRLCKQPHEIYEYLKL